ncbi:murein biosynthesis integral membrane protein MurJ, partial [Candidatus Peregrinibacteria bacterium]|nr:murein biosynthesis integral membrane protein MurJ [Candidatus Peregrinibacteria bacterium]
MHKKIFKPIQIGGATALIAITSFLSYAIGLVRDRIIAVNFGTSNETDTYNASFLIPDMLFNLFIAGALTAAFMPVFSDYLVKDKREAYRLADTMLTSAVLAIGALAIVAFIFMPHLTSLLFTDTDAAMQKDIINMTRLMLISAILFAISNTLGNILMSYKHFFSYAISPILYNLGIILGVIFLSDKFGIYSAAIGVIIGAGLHCAIRIIDAVMTDYKYKPRLEVSHPGFKKILKLMVPKSISLISWQINLYIYAVVGIKMLEGGLAAFHFARNIQSFAVSLFGISFATAVFPYLANAASKDDKEDYTAHIQKTIQRILFFTIPAMVGIMIMSTQLVELILSGGVFNQKSIDLTSKILFFFAVSIPFEGLSHIFARAYYVRKDTTTPMIINVLSMCVIAFITIFIAPNYGIEWFSIAFSVGFVFYICLMILSTKKHLQNFKTKEFSSSILKTIISSGLMAVVILLSAPLHKVISTKLADILQLAIGVIGFFSFAIILKSPEVGSIKYIFQRVFK